MRSVHSEGCSIKKAAREFHNSASSKLEVVKMLKSCAMKVNPADVPPPSQPGSAPQSAPAPVPAVAANPDPEPDVILPPPQQAGHSKYTGGDTSDAVSVSPIP